EAPADDAFEWVQPVLESCRDAEVAAAPAEAPQQLGVLVSAGMDDRAAGRDELCTDQVVARQSVLSGQVADAPAESQAGNAGRANDAPGRDEPRGLRRRVVVEPSRAALRAGDPPFVVNLDRAHERKIDHHSVVTDAVSGRVVATAAYSYLQGLRSGESEGGRDVGRVEAPCDHRGSAIDESVEAATCPVVR